MPSSNARGSIPSLHRRWYSPLPSAGSSARAPYPPGTRVHPTPIYELIEAIITFSILWSLRKRGYAPGTIAWLYLILTGISRFVVEFWRINPVLAVDLTESQWITRV